MKKKSPFNFSIFLSGYASNIFKHNNIIFTNVEMAATNTLLLEPESTLTLGIAQKCPVISVMINTVPYPAPLKGLAMKQKLDVTRFITVFQIYYLE